VWTCLCELDNTSEIAEASNVNAKTSLIITRLKSGSLKQKSLTAHKLQTTRKTLKQNEPTKTSDKSQLDVMHFRKPAKSIWSEVEGVVLEIETPVSPEKSESQTFLIPKLRRPRKQYVCLECGRELKSKSSLDIHIRTHTGDRPFICPICGREFRTNGNLTRHQVTRMHWHKFLLNTLSFLWCLCGLMYRVGPKKVAP